MDVTEEGRFGGAFGGGHLWCYSCDHAGFWCRQSITWGLAPCDRLLAFDQIQLLIGSDGAELSGAAYGGLGSIGLEIVEEK